MFSRASVAEEFSLAQAKNSAQSYSGCRNPSRVQVLQYTATFVRPSAHSQFGYALERGLMSSR